MVLLLLGLYPQACMLVCMVLLLLGVWNDQEYRLGVYPQACMLVCMVLLLLGVHPQACPRRSVSSSVYACMYGFTPPRTVSSSVSEEECILKRVCMVLLLLGVWNDQEYRLGVCPQACACMYGFTPPRSASSSVSEEECILKRVCLYVWFYSSSDCILKGVRGGVYPQACMLVLLLGVYPQACPRRSVSSSVYACMYGFTPRSVERPRIPPRSVSSGVYACMYGFAPPRSASSSVSEEECILKRVCLYVWFYSS
jgi:hypothetical protein